MNAILDKLGKKINGNIDIPGDKSISIRAALISNLFDGDFEFKNFNFCDDAKAALNAIKTLSKISITNNKTSNVTIDCGNSATTMRLLSGMLVSLYQGENIVFKLTGDTSLSKRPMNRIVKPLRQMGADINASKNGTCPLIINCKNCHIKNLKYTSDIASAQVKSALELASFCAGTKLTYKEPVKSRDHTKIMLDFFSHHEHCNCKHHEHIYTIPSDVSLASYYIANAIIYKGSSLKIKNLLINPTRTGFLDTIKKMGIRISVSNKEYLQGEKVADISLKSLALIKLKPINISKKAIPSMIDELVVLCVLLSKADGVSTIKGISELRCKESDRVKAISDLLDIIGTKHRIKNDTITIYGNKDTDLATMPKNIKSKSALARLQSSKDHRVLLTLKLLNIKGIKYKEYLNTSL